MRTLSFLFNYTITTMGMYSRNYGDSLKRDWGRTLTTMGTYFSYDLIKVF